MPEFSFSASTNGVSYLCDAYSLPRLRPEIDIGGNIDQNALKYLFGQEINREYVICQPKLWYNGINGAKRAETKINGEDMLVHFV